MHIPGRGRLNKGLSTYLGSVRKAGFEKFTLTNDFRELLQKKIRSRPQISLELVTFVDSKNFTDLLLSILSLIHSAGLPHRWTIYMDDAFSPEQQEIFNQFPFLIGKPWNENVPENEQEKYTGKWQFRKYLCFTNHSFTVTTVFLDSDVLFYEQFDKYKEYLYEGNWYLPEPVDAFSMDEEISKRKDYKPGMYIVNAGFMVLNKRPPWDIGLQYLGDCLRIHSKNYFIDQSALNMVYVNDPNAKILEPRIFHVSTVDHFDLSFVKTSDLAIRHYVGPIRYKMWQAGWKQFI